MCVHLTSEQMAQWNETVRHQDFQTQREWYQEAKRELNRERLYKFRVAKLKNEFRTAIINQAHERRLEAIEFYDAHNFWLVA